MSLFRLFLFICCIGLGVVPGREAVCAATTPDKIHALPVIEREPLQYDIALPGQQSAVPDHTAVSPVPVHGSCHIPVTGWLLFAAVLFLQEQAGPGRLRQLWRRLLAYFRFPQLSFLYPRHSFW